MGTWASGRLEIPPDVAKAWLKKIFYAMLNGGGGGSSVESLLRHISPPAANLSAERHDVEESGQVQEEGQEEAITGALEQKVAFCQAMFTHPYVNALRYFNKRMQRFSGGLYSPLREEPITRTIKDKETGEIVFEGYKMASPLMLTVEYITISRVWFKLLEICVRDGIDASFVQLQHDGFYFLWPEEVPYEPVLKEIREDFRDWCLEFYKMEVSLGEQ